MSSVVLPVGDAALRDAEHLCCFLGLCPEVKPDLLEKLAEGRRVIGMMAVEGRGRRWTGKGVWVTQEAVEGR